MTLLSKGFDENRSRRAGPSAVGGRGGHRVAGGLVMSKLRTSQLGPAGSQGELREGGRKVSARRGPCPLCLCGSCRAFSYLCLVPSHCSGV